MALRQLARLLDAEIDGAASDLRHIGEEIPQ